MMRNIDTTTSISVHLALLATVIPPNLLWGAPTVQPEYHDPGWLYSATHLPPVIYVVLFFIFLLSMFNLAFQNQLLFRMTSLARLKFWGSTPRQGDDSGAFIKSFDQKGRQKNFRGAIRGPESYRMSKETLQEGIVSVRPAAQVIQEKHSDFMPTPLDGEDHPIPEFGATSKPKSNSLKQGDIEKENSIVTKEFKFSSAVDLPSPEEIERREREKIVVTGRVLDSESHGLATAVVYLVDRDGNKIGQSCRTNSENGSFRVQANQSGACSINVYKRGYVMNADQPVALSAKSGKITGVDIHMIPEGCLIHGKVLSEEDLNPIPDLVVNCACRSEQFKSSSITDSNGAFQTVGAPLNTECVIQVMTPDGKILLNSKPFETVQKKQIFMEFKVKNSDNDLLKPSTENQNHDVEEVAVLKSDLEPAIQPSVN